MKQLSFLFLALAFTLFSCKENTPDPVPTNLTLSASVSADNSGDVMFTASATDAVSYDFDFGNGIYQTVASGSVTYTYPTSGTYTVNVTAKGSTGQKVSKSISVVVDIVIETIGTWSDEFSTPGAPDPAKWGFDLGGGGWGNNEVQYYTKRSDNSIVSDGTLKIILKKETYSGSQFTSARLLSKGKFSFKYGKIEARIKLPAGGGTWAAFWMLGDNISTVSWPACGEIDIMEHVGNQLNRIFSTLHHPGHSGGNGDGSSLVISNATSEFHVYSLEWSPTTIKTFVDDVPIYTFINKANLPFNQNFFIILNVAMGGNFGGNVDPNFTSAQMEVDYVRVFQ